MAQTTQTTLTPSQTLADSLLGTKVPPAGLARIQGLAREARAYHELDAYPMYAFRDWKIEDRGVLPRVLPLPKSIVERGAKWLFRRPLQVRVPGNTKLEKFLKKAWKKNRLDTRLVAMAKDAALDGGIVLKFSYDSTDKKTGGLSIQSLSLIDECRLFRDPHDAERILMARVQYPFQDPATGDTMWFREDWNAETYVEYQPLKASNLGAAFNPDTSDQWIELKRSDNPFGEIPLHVIKNIETDDSFGSGDLWTLYRIIDRICLTAHLMDRSNQFDSQVNPIFLDVEVDEQDADHPLQPGQPLEVTTKPDALTQGKVLFPSGENGLRPQMLEYANWLRDQVLASCSSVEPDVDEVSNKGAMTQAVLEQLYLPQIQITEEKRKTWGEDGLEPFLALVARCLQRVGVDLGVNENDEDSYTVSLGWAQFFNLSQDEKIAVVSRMVDEIANDFITQERAIEIVAEAEQITDIIALKAEISIQVAAKIQAAQDALEAAKNNPSGSSPLTSSTGVQGILTQNTTTSNIVGASGSDAK